MSNSQDNTSLKNNNIDYVVSAAKSILGAAPFVGNLLSEIAGSIIPSQRIDRVAKFVKILENRLSTLEKSVIEKNLSDEYFVDLMEESLRQSAKSLSDDRRTYLSSLIVNNILSEDIEHLESKHLLRILGDLNDIEIIWLRFYLNPMMNSDIEFREKYKNILKPAPKNLGSSQSEIDKSTLQNSYKEHLVSIGLLEKQIDIKTGKKTELKTKGYEITSLGRLLLREIGYYDNRLG